ncbi:MAG: SDR family oxidoreductase [Lewinella sp.]|nr:SDR family oxidoreductase [Lewinella sp.]
MDTYLITGASRGIGRATVVALAAVPGRRLLAVARSEAALAALAAELAEAPSEVAYLAFDLTAEDYSPLLLWLAPYGRLAGLLNNAGNLRPTPAGELTLADWQLSFSLNVFAPARLAAALHSSLPAGSHVVNIGSMGGFQGSIKFPGLAAYSAAKAALAVLSECLAAEWAHDGIAVNCLAFGAVQTEMLSIAFPGYQAPLTPDAMGSFVAWFLTQGQLFFNGKILPVALNNP